MTDKAAQKAANTAETKVKGTMVRLEFSLLVKRIIESMVEYTDFQSSFFN